MVAATARQHRALVLALLASLVLWNLPFGGFVLYPFKLLATWLHELSHGLVMLVVGAGFERMEIYRDTSGFAFSELGTGALGQAAIASAGYMGTAVFGAAFLVLGRTRRGAKAVLASIGFALAISALLWVRNDFGMGAVLAGAGAFLLAAGFASERIARLLLNFVAVQACINAVLDIRTLFRSNLVVDGQVMQASDAHNMAVATFGTPWMWATLWMVWSFAMFYLALRTLSAPELTLPASAAAPAPARAVSQPQPVAVTPIDPGP